MSVLRATVYKKAEPIIASFLQEAKVQARIFGTMIPQYFEEEKRKRYNTSMSVLRATVHKEAEPIIASFLQGAKV